MKTLALSLAGFLTPILLALYVTAIVFDQGLGSPAVVGASQPSRLEQKSVPKSIQIGTGASYASIASDESLNPEAGKYFLVAFLVKFDALPSPNSRHNVIAKYSADERPYPGWAFSINRFETSVRPEVYMKSKFGKGGWYTFEDFEVELGRWYAFTLITKPGDFMNLFLQDLSGGVQATEEGEQPVQRELTTVSPVKFAGGYELSGMRAPATEAPLVIGASRKGANTFRGELGLILVAKPRMIDTSIASLTKQFDGGPSYIVKRLDPEAVSLWVSRRGIDESSFAREIELSGSAGWQTSH